MKKKMLFVRIFFVTVAALVLGICNVCSVSTVEAQTILKLGHTDQSQGVRQETAEMFAKKVAQYTNGRYTVQTFCCSQLGNDQKLAEQMVLGGIDFQLVGIGIFATHLPLMNLTMLPYLFDSYEQGWKIYDESKWLHAQFAKGPERGFRFLAMAEAGFRCMTTKEPLNSPADAKGKKIRTYPMEMQRWLLEAIGFSVQIMPLPEVYMAIQQGVVSGQENPIDTIWSNKFYEVAPYLTLTKHVYSPAVFMVSEKTWRKLSQADREAVTKASREAGDWCRKTVKANDENQIKDMVSKGAKLMTPPVEPFRQAVQSVYDRARDKYGAADVNAFLAEVEAVRKAMPAK